MHVAREVAHLLEQYQVPSALIALAVIAILFYEAYEKGMLDFLTDRVPPPTPTPPGPPDSDLIPETAPDPTFPPDPVPDPAPPLREDDDAPELSEPYASPVRPPTTFDILVETRVRYDARRAVAGSEERLRRLEALIATRDATLARGDTPTPRTTAHELLEDL
jgi:hypothetical protein